MMAFCQHAGLSLTNARTQIDALYASLEAQDERLARGEDVPRISIAELLGTVLVSWPLPSWAKWVRWVEDPESGLLEPEIGGMAFVNQAYVDRYDKDAETYMRHDDERMWGQTVGAQYNLADISSVYREAGPAFWDRIGHGWWGPRYWEPIGEGPGQPEVDSVKSVARDRNGVIRLCTGMVVNEQPGWNGGPR